MNRRTVWLVASLLLGLPAWAGPDDAKHPGRLVVADGKVGMLRVIDLEKGEVMASFSAPGPANVYTAGNGMYAFALHREQNRVSVVYGGLRQEDHGDHKDLVVEAPYILQTFTTGPKPTHFSSHNGMATIFNDGDGTVAVIDEKSLGLNLRMFEIATGAPDHGAPLAVGNLVLAGSLNRGWWRCSAGAGRRSPALAAARACTARLCWATGSPTGAAMGSCCWSARAMVS